MYRFAHSEYLYALYLLPLLILLFWYTTRTKNKILGNTISEKMQELLIPGKSKVKVIVKFVLWCLAFISLVVALANPQIGSKIEEVKQVGIDVFIILDVSKSMQAEDVKPNRLEKAKFDIAKLVQRLRGDRIGLVVFAGQAYIQFPLTTDYAAANLFLSAVNFNSIPQQGTNLAAAIRMANKSFKKETETKKAIVVITDGEDHEGDIDGAVSESADEGIVIYTIGLGSPGGVPIPVFDGRGNRVSYKSDINGQTVLTKLNEDILKKIASDGNGKYFHSRSEEDELEKIYYELSQIEKTEYGATRITEYEDRFYYFIALALLFITVEFFISNKKNKIFAKLEGINLNQQN